ncbi:molybdenum cofactor cytidylyltransferase [Kribbella orskensis]|uniref:Molybdenum cofactor cytidylyltransferase n=1 Tax=Kribbella orskensis TaxID=2512216 RepID=A0ABY2BDL0_9ACTN|nr:MULTISPECIES: nucleotidyltransferase family protein [Kribbella]TCN33642.1 molybdenum cofactor cytidylyltransferase [Kribbella sp. VKM Ac-2500]TCO13951.1 molybdenum cofactor cytidylyltransferase [Kribbella orskensis]
MFVTGLVLAADGSPRLGVPKELLSYQGETLLGASLDTARECGFDQLIVTLGTASEQVRERVDLDGAWVVDSPHADTGSSSIVPALDVVDRRTDGIVVMLGDQPGVTSATVWSLVAEVAGPATPIGVSRYDNGQGHPCWFGRELFGELRQLRSDLDVWGLIRAGRHPITEVDAAGNIPLRVETWEDYQTLVALPDIEEEAPVVPPAALPTRGRLSRRRSRRPKV